MAKGAKGKHDLQQFVLVLARLAMICSRELANVLPDGQPLMLVAGLEADARYSQQEDFKDQEAGDQGRHVEPRPSPHAGIRDDA